MCICVCTYVMLIYACVYIYIYIYIYNPNGANHSRTHATTPVLVTSRSLPMPRHYPTPSDDDVVLPEVSNRQAQQGHPAPAPFTPNSEHKIPEHAFFSGAGWPWHLHFHRMASTRARFPVAGPGKTGNLVLETGCETGTSPHTGPPDPPQGLDAGSLAPRAFRLLVACSPCAAPMPRPSRPISMLRLRLPKSSRGKQSGGTRPERSITRDHCHHRRRRRPRCAAAPLRVLVPADRR